MYYMTIHKVDSHRASPLNWGLVGAPSCPLYLEVWYSMYLTGPRSRCLVRTYGTDPYRSGMICTWMTPGLEGPGTHGPGTDGSPLSVWEPTRLQRILVFSQFITSINSEIITLIIMDRKG